MDWKEMMEDSDLFSETPTQLIPKMGEFPVSNSAFYFLWQARSTGTGRVLYQG